MSTAQASEIDLRNDVSKRKVREGKRERHAYLAVAMALADVTASLLPASPPATEATAAADARLAWLAVPKEPLCTTTRLRSVLRTANHAVHAVD